MRRDVLKTKYPELGTVLAHTIHDALWDAVLAELFSNGKVHVKHLGWLELQRGDKTERYYVREAIAALTVISNNTVKFEPDRELCEAIKEPLNPINEVDNCRQG
jgi:hypothetical protein